MNELNYFCQNEESFKKIADFMPQFVWLADGDGKIFWFNKAWHEYTGITPQEFEEVGWGKVPHPDHLQRVIDSFRNAVENERAWEETFLMKRADGNWKWFLTRANPLRDENGKVFRWVGYNTDVTKQKEAERKLLNSETRYKMAGLATKDIIWDWDLITNRISWNQALTEELGHTEESQESSIYWWEDHIHPEDRQRVVDSINRAIKSGYEMWKDEYRFLKGDGKYAVILDRGYIAKNQSGDPVRMIGAMMDVTHERLATEQLKEAKFSAEAANKAKTSFLANMSHEVRTPLSAILGFVELLKTQGLEKDELEEFLGVIERNSHQLLRIIDDVLDLARVDAGSLSVEHVSFDLDEMLDDIISLMEGKALKKGIKFKVRKHFGPLSGAGSDPVRLKQILINVVGNALKFTKKGKVSLDVEYHGSYMYFRVSDTGIGISMEQQKNIFEPFNQGDVSNSKEFGGTGLGLALAKKLCQSMGGDLYLVNSEPGKGSVFEAKIIVEVDSQKDAHLATSTEFKKNFLEELKVLVIDDSDDNRLLTQKLLSAYGASVETAASGVGGLELALRKKFDVILLDIRMPDLDGYEVLEKLKEKDIDVPVVALTAHAMKEERIKALKIGFRAFLTKPLNLEETLNTLHHLGSGHKPKKDATNQDDLNHHPGL